ncbi:ABC transporter ATP-binding protein [Herbaspirillum sp. meg3]|jgi:NitT/TauT family transport system ATP-binding protein|uniref:ABC transporter ATP-binding protein n=1 Tax=Herbaspirillum sp. meg3 TaxID=2025949 RepID=UPI000B980816|nr:ABC transporter ATP-binding protein [Herbaspirillum sp. meg3]ASU40826.1 ABC transporter ATP-binding protein [Herbaspirillum sp. meg3]
MNQIAQLPARVQLAGISKSFASGKQAATPVLSDISLELEQGELVCLLGPSGCGKSTILNLIAGFEQTDSGAILLDGSPVNKPGPERGVVFQQPTLFPWLSVLDNVTFGPRMAGVKKSAYLPEAERYLRLVGLQDFYHHMPWQLSGGMRQRVALARAWLPNPEILLMDEPFGALDAQTRLMMQELLTSVWQKTGTTILFITHDVDEALFLADRVLVMSARPGRICAEFKIPFPRPRDVEVLVADVGYGALKQKILHIVREEARKSMAGTAP